MQPPDGQPPGRVAFKSGTSDGHRDAGAFAWGTGCATLAAVDAEGRADRMHVQMD